MTAEAAVPAPKLTHGQARKLWGAPDAWEGNVNDPRTREEFEVRYNEKWIYFLPDGARRLVYWYRYGCRAVLRQKPDGSVTPETL